MKFRRSILIATLGAFALAISGCGGSSTPAPPPPPAVTVTLSGAPTSLATSATASITATVSNSAGVTWTVTCATAPCGSFAPATTASGVATTYTAPSAATSVAISATTASGATASATITITAPVQPISVAFSPAAPTTLTTAATANLTAVVTNDAANAGVNWTVTCSGSACGSFNPTKTASGTATAYTAPSAVPTSGTVTVTATSVTDTTKAASANITITAPSTSITVALTPTPPTSLAVSTTSSITATVSNDSANGGVTWTVTCGTSGGCGSFSAASTASGTATVYTAPATVPNPNTVTITATSVTDTTKSSSATITITPPAAIAVALNPTPPASLIVGATASLTAVVSNDSKNGGATWTVTCGTSGACGSFSAASTASGTATVYTAPATVPNPNTVTITATSVTDTTKSASATVTITPVLADGTYVYHFSGWDNNGPSFFVGAFTVAGGVITGGEQDFSDAANGFPLVALAPANCSLSAAGNNIQVVLGLANNTTIGVNGIETVRGIVVSSSRVLITEFDSFGSATGSIDLQTTPVAAPSGGYAFLTSGWDINHTVNPPTFLPLAIGGVFNFTGTSLTITNSVFDYNVAGQVGQALLFASGSLSGPDPYGRVSFSLTPTSTSNVPAFILTGYIISPGQIRLVESQADALSDDLGGVALGQGSNAGGFNLGSLANTTYVFASSGQDVNSSATFGGLATFGGNLSFSSSGALSGTLAINDGTNAVATGITGGNYIVDATGRATLTGIITSQFPNDAFTFQLYLDGNGNALHLGADPLEITSGPAYLKTATSNDFEGPYALAGSGIINATNLPAWGAVGPVTLTSDTLTGTADYGAQGLTPTPAVAVTAAENSTASTLSVVGLDSSSFTTSRLYSYFPIDNKRVFAIEIDGAQLGILSLESTSH